MTKTIKMVVSGVGNRALPKDPDRSNWYGWIDLISKSEGFELVAAHDPSDESLKRVIDRGYLGHRDVYTDLTEMLTNSNCDAILISNPAEFHAETLQKAVDRGLHILVEKPFVTDIEQGKRIVNAIETKGLTSCVIQNWRYKDVGRKIFKAIRDGQLGRVGHIFFRYVRNRENPSYPKYIFEEEYPLLYAMGIHHFDLFRYVLDDEISSVGGSAFKPPWSMYKSKTGVNLYFETKKGVPLVYTGTISSANGGIPQENLIIEGEKGSLVNESHWLEPPLWFYPVGGGERIELTAEIVETSTRQQYDISDRYILDKFYASVAFGEEEICSARSGFMSVCVVEASRLACKKGRRILLSEIIS